MQYETSKYTWEAQSPKDLTVFLRNLDESVTPEEAKILDLPDGRKISDYFCPVFKGKGGFNLTKSIARPVSDDYGSYASACAS